MGDIFSLVLQMGCSRRYVWGCIIVDKLYGSIPYIGNMLKDSIREIDSDGTVVCEMDDNTFPEEIL